MSMAMCWRVVRAVVAAGLIALPPILAAAAGVAVSGTVDAPDFFPDVAESPDGGRLVAAWITDEANLNRDVRVATSTDGGATWSSEVTLYQAARGMYLQPVRIIYDTTGTVHLVFMAGLGDGRTIYHRLLPPGGDPTRPDDWRAGPVICRPCISPDLAVDSDGRVYVLYEATTGQRRLGIRRSGGPSGAWGPERAIVVGDSLRGALAVTPDGRIHVAYHTVSNRIASYARYTSYDDFRYEAGAYLGSGAAEAPDIAAGLDGRVHIAYESKDQPIYRAIEGDGVGEPVALSGTLSGPQNVTITVDGDGRPYVSWSTANLREVHLAWQTGGGWGRPGRISAPGVVARYQEFGHSHRGTVYLAFVEGNVARVAGLSGAVPAAPADAAPAPPSSPDLTPPTSRQPAPPEPIPDRPYFPETGHFLAGGFRTFWEQNGRLPIFGLPLTVEFDEPNPETGQWRVVQYLERQRFEYHPEQAGTPYETMLGRLGAADARARGLFEEPAFTPRPGPEWEGDCEFFAETGHHLCAGFRAYWRSIGLELGDEGVSTRESVALFGFPISEEYSDPETGLTVQHFERVRLEFHGGEAPEYQVQVTRLGAQLLAERGW